MPFRVLGLQGLGFRGPNTPGAVFCPVRVGHVLQFQWFFFAVLMVWYKNATAHAGVCKENVVDMMTFVGSVSVAYSSHLVPLLLLLVTSGCQG